MLLNGPGKCDLERGTVRKQEGSMLLIRKRLLGSSGSTLPNTTPVTPLHQKPTLRYLTVSSRYCDNCVNFRPKSHQATTAHGRYSLGRQCALLVAACHLTLVSTRRVDSGISNIGRDSVYVCVCLRMLNYILVCIYMYTLTCTHLCAYVFLSACLYVCAPLCVYFTVCIYIYICIYMCVCVCVCVCGYSPR